MDLHWPSCIDYLANVAGVEQEPPCPASLTKLLGAGPGARLVPLSSCCLLLCSKTNPNIHTIAPTDGPPVCEHLVSSRSLVGSPSFPFSDSPPGRYAIEVPLYTRLIAMHISTKTSLPFQKQKVCELA